jgi:hypothetical protein
MKNDGLAAAKIVAHFSQSNVTAYFNALNNKTSRYLFFGFSATILNLAPLLQLVTPPHSV